MKPKLAFLWDGYTTHKERWRDGLWLALQYLEHDFTIRYFEPLDKAGIDKFKPDLLLFWGALTENCKETVASYPYKKAICFAGGAIEPSNVGGFDLFFVESAINEKELKALDKPYMRAFGVNDLIFTPQKYQKLYTAMFAGTYALWKRHILFAESVGSKGITMGIKQDWEKECYEVCEKNGVTTLEEQTRHKVADYINESHVVLNPADFWGGGQRLTLEAMACNVPPIVMSDSPKNCELVEDAWYGFIAEPNVQSIKKAIFDAKSLKRHTGRDYIMSKWSGLHYYKNLLKGLKSI